ncbi:hypothetical protein EVAR_48101_1 [Eumeta japonica]|uniref:Uncharacterized protein n=1 Tax=Eumeta variegata TaxID=151549 RepID=A0A4C1XLG5_EUMVA|nr:hypothetical protein EVAR_48101_1 [Eumeta japonica]
MPGCVWSSAGGAGAGDEGGGWGVRVSGVECAAALLLAAMAAVLLAAVGYQCAATWRWLMARLTHYGHGDNTIGRTVARRSRRESEESGGEGATRAAIRISHSLPELQTEPLQPHYVQEHKDAAKKWRPLTERANSPESARGRSAGNSLTKAHVFRHSF